MTPDRHQQIQEVFHAALERELAQRGAYLDEACRGDAELRREVESLLAAHQEEAGFLESLPLPASALPRPPASEAPMVGRRIGPYKILQEIGQGGMGTVYLARRADDQYRKRVAIKLIQPGMGSEAIVRRFLNERQILAGLDHPNIAKLLDGGTTPEGLPYFVMDYVEGLPITVYCDTHQLSTVERLKLFRTVCAAVHYAHQNLVVHRDLKPSNILVTANGGPKLLDFGVAKLLNPELSAQTLEPTAAVRLMTPDYASPEQVRGGPIATASDVYSLGVLLYELLTGHRPYRIASYTPQEIERVICETEPEKPSTVIGRAEEVASADGANTVRRTPAVISAARGDAPERLRRQLQGDLDNIVLMALRKEPERRYGSVEKFSEDIGRHLEGRPVSARKDTLWYRSAKFIKRSKAAVLAATLSAGIVLALVVGFYFLAQRERAPGQAIDSIAILPLVNASGNADAEYLSDGMTETLISRLSQLPKLNVKARSSVFRYKGKETNPTAIGKELNVQAVLNGRVVQRGEQLTLSLELVDVQTENVLWSAQYNRQPTDLVALQSEIAHDVSSGLKLKLSGAEAQKLTKNDTEKSEAYRLYLQGRYHWLRFPEPGYERSRVYYEQAIKVDPNYALAYAGLSEYHGFGAATGLLPPDENWAKSEAAANKALSLDDTLPDAYNARAGVKQSKYDHAGAERDLQRAIELNPNYAEGRAHYAAFLSHEYQRFEESLAQHQKVLELEPLSVRYNHMLAEHFYFRRAYDRALEQCRRTLDLEPNNASTHELLGSVFEQKGMFKEAIAEWSRALTLMEDHELAQLLERTYAASGFPAAVRALWQKKLTRLNAGAKGGAYVPAMYYALAYTRLADKDQAFAWLAKAEHERNGVIGRVRLDPVYDPLRADPRYQTYQAWLKKVSFSQ